MQLSIAAALVSLGVLATPAAAQTTWIVDANSGPGTNFTEIRTAMLSVQDGDIVLVRQGDYLPFNVTAAITVRGEPGVRIVGYTILLGGSGLSVTGIAAGETATLSGIDFSRGNLTLGGSSLTVRSSPGRILFDDVQFSGLPGSIGASEVWFTDASMPGGLEVVQSTVVLANSTLRGFSGTPNLPALNAIDSSVVVSRCTLLGVTMNGPQSSTSGLVLSNSRVTVTDDRGGAIVAGVGTQPRSAISGTGTLTIDPGVSVVGNGGAPPIAATLNVTTRTVPSLRASGPDASGQIEVDLFSGFGENYLIFIGLPVTPVPLPLFGGDLALSANMFEVGNGVQGLTGRAVLEFTVGPYQNLIGAPIAWQALSGTFSTQFYLSNPDFVVLRR